ncbi:MAG: hypothetical protein V1873_07470 [Verrucomicrobiota bacterium]
MLLEYFRQVVHAGSWPILALLYGAGGAYAGMLARGMAVAGHIVCAVCLYRILRRPLLTRHLSPWAASIYLLSPYYFARGLMELSVFDVFIFLYLLSILLLRQRRRLFHVLAFVAFLISLSVETLVFLEPLRLVFVHRPRQALRRSILRVSPFWTAAGVLLVARVLWLTPSGHYAGYNKISMSIIDLLWNWGRHGWYYVKGAGFMLHNAVRMISLPGLLLLFAAFAALLLASRSSVTKGVRGNAMHARALLFGVLLAALGALPYALAGRVPTTQMFESRFAYVSIPGISIAAAAVAAMIPCRFCRALMRGCLLIVLGLSSLFVGKWYMYDWVVQRDLARQLHRALADVTTPSLYRLKMTPSSTNVLFLGRAFSAEDLNVPLNLLRPAEFPLVFVYDDNYFASPWAFPDGMCTITTNDRYPRPASCIDLEYRLNSNAASVDHMSFADLLRSGRGSPPPEPFLGVLTSGRVGSSGGENDTPKSRRAGGDVVNRMLHVVPDFEGHR